MGLTYTPNLGLAMQEDKTEKLDWDALTENWRIIDAKIGTQTLITTSAPYYYNPAQQGIGTAEIVKEAENGSFD